MCAVAVECRLLLPTVACVRDPGVRGVLRASFLLTGAGREMHAAPQVGGGFGPRARPPGKMRARARDLERYPVLRPAARRERDALVFGFDKSGADIRV